MVLVLDLSRVRILYCSTKAHSLSSQAANYMAESSSSDGRALPNLQSILSSLASLFSVQNPFDQELKAVVSRAQKTHSPPFSELPERESIRSVYHGCEEFKLLVEDFVSAINHPMGWAGLAAPESAILLIGHKGVGKSAMVINLLLMVTQGVQCVHFRQHSCTKKRRSFTYTA